MTGEIIQTITYGRDHDGDVDFVQLGGANTMNLGRAALGYTVEYFPWRK